MTTHKEALRQAGEAYKAHTGYVRTSGIEAAIRAYIDARGLVMVPKRGCDEMRDAASARQGESDYVALRWESPDDEVFAVFHAVRAGRLCSRMMRTVEQYAKCDPYAIITGSHAQVLYFMKDAKADIAELAAENERLRLVLQEARGMVAHWGAYASEYFQEKHDLAGDLGELDAALEAKP